MAFLHQISCRFNSKQCDCLSSVQHQNVSFNLQTEAAINLPDNRYRRYLEVAGISHGGKGQGPRLHDIRHTFAVHVLQKWIKEEADLSAMLPILSTYMGHKSVRSTAQYLRLTAEVYPDLMKKVEKSCAYVIPEVCHERN